MNLFLLYIFVKQNLPLITLTTMSNMSKGDNKIIIVCLNIVRYRLFQSLPVPTMDNSLEHASQNSSSNNKENHEKQKAFPIFLNPSRSVVNCKYPIIDCL